jgi:hypothetical protein
VALQPLPDLKSLAPCLRVHASTQLPSNIACVGRQFRFFTGGFVAELLNRLSQRGAWLWSQSCHTRPCPFPRCVTYSGGTASTKCMACR